MIYWDQVSWKDPLIISPSQERLHYTGNCFYFIWPHLFLTELITNLTSNVWELRAEIRRWLQVSECEECVGGWLSRSGHHVWCGLVSPSWGEGGVSLQMARVITLCLTRDTFYQWWLANDECQRWESWGDGKHEQHSAQNTNHTAVESDYHFTCLTTMKVWAPCWQISPCHDSWDPGKLHISLSLNISHPCNRFMIATWCASLTSRLQRK